MTRKAFVSSLFLILMVFAALPHPASACQLILGVRSGVLEDVRPGLPNREAVRVVGVVTGYSAVTRAVGQALNVVNAATLRVRIEEVVSGKVGKTETDVVLLEYVSDCSSVGTSRESLAGGYPVGTAIVLLGQSIPGFTDPAMPAILAEKTQGAFVGVLPRNVNRIPTGELHFRSYQNSDWFAAFEFDRALLALADSPVGERFARLLNLADYPYSRAPSRNEREFYSRLVSEYGFTGPEARQLLERFDD